MSQLRVNFLNWRPDVEPIQNDGLTIAQNTYHDADGYKPLKLATSGAVSTIQSFSSPVSLVSVQTRQVGSLMDDSQNNKIHCRLTNTSGTSANFAVLPPNLVGATSVALTTATGTTKPCATGPAITAFQVCELEEKVFITAEAEGEGVSGTALSANITAYMDISI